MKILAIEHDSGKENSSSLLREEAKQVWELQASGVIREIYFRCDRREAVVMLECSNVEEAHTILSTLPLVKAGSISFELIPLSTYTAISRLFASNTAGDR